MFLQAMLLAAVFYQDIGQQISIKLSQARSTFSLLS
jgi:hypothetical protein